MSDDTIPLKEILIRQKLEAEQREEDRKLRARFPQILEETARKAVLKGAVAVAKVVGPKLTQAVKLDEIADGQRRLEAQFAKTQDAIRRLASQGDDQIPPANRAASSFEESVAAAPAPALPVLDSAARIALRNLVRDAKSKRMNYRQIAELFDTSNRDLMDDQRFRKWVKDFEIQCWYDMLKTAKQTARFKKFIADLGR